MASIQSPSGQSRPLAALTPSDKSGVVIIATSLCLIFSLFSMAIRVFVRQSFRRAHIGLDDVTSITSMVGCPASPRSRSPRLTEPESEGNPDNPVCLCFCAGRKRIREDYWRSIIHRSGQMAASMTLS